MITHGIKIKIETYWNVNAEQIKLLATGFSIKIETYWNVNLGQDVVIFEVITLK